MKMKMKKRRLISLLLAFVMIIRLVPVPFTYADEGTPGVCDCGYVEELDRVTKATDVDATMNGHTESCSINKEVIQPTEQKSSVVSALSDGTKTVCTCGYEEHIDSEEHKLATPGNCDRIWHLEGCPLYGSDPDNQDDIKDDLPNNTQNGSSCSGTNPEKTVKSPEKVVLNTALKGASKEMESELICTCDQDVHTEDCALYYSNNLNKLAKFNKFMGEAPLLISATPSNATSEKVEIRSSNEIPSDLVVEIIDWKIDDYDNLWYKVELVESETIDLNESGEAEITNLEELLEDYPWVLQYFTKMSMGDGNPPALLIKEDILEKKVTVNGVDMPLHVEGNLPFGAKIEARSVAIDPEEFGIEDFSSVIASMDIKVLEYNGDEWQPEEGEEAYITLDAIVLELEDGFTTEILHEHNDVVSSLGEWTVANGKLRFRTNGFSIYVVIGTYLNNWNYNNYQIVMTVGDSLQVSTSSRGDNYSWSKLDDNNNAFTIANDKKQEATITANHVGEMTIQCTFDNGNNKKKEQMKIIALDSPGISANDDIIFANVNISYTSGDTKYENTYGPYVMKIRFEDDKGNVLKSNDVTVGEDFYVFDSNCNIDVNTFAASAPDGYTYAGAFFYWSGHFAGEKVYVTNVERENSNTEFGSHLYYSGTHNSNGNGRWAYQASGVLHVVYAPVNEVHTVIFKDHCGYNLANYALPHNDGGVEFPKGYVDNIENMSDSLILDHHNAHDPGYEFQNKWEVTGGGPGIDGIYTTKNLKEKIRQWSINSNITITAACEKKKGNLTITKNVEGIETSTQAFTFTVSGQAVNADKEYTVKITGPGSSITTSKVTANRKGQLAINLTDGQSATIQNLNLAAYTVVEQSYDDYVTTSTGSTGTIAMDDSASALFTNTYAPKGILKVTKVLKKEYSRDADPSVTNFEFTLTLPSTVYDAQYPYEIYSDGATPSESDDTKVSGENVTLSASNNTIKFELKDNQYILIKDLPVGKYTITEKSYSEYGFKDPVYNDSNPTIVSNTTTCVVCTNTYMKTTGTLTISKTMASNTVDDGQYFLFHIKGSDGLSMSIKLKAGESKTIYDLPLGTYTVTEDTSWNWRYTTKTNGKDVELKYGESDAKVVFENSRKKDQWLNFVINENNIFSKSK